MNLFGAGLLLAKPTRDYAGTAITTPTGRPLAVVQELNMDFSRETKSLYGEKQFPVAIGAGKAKMSFKAKLGDIDTAAIAALYTGRTPTTTVKAPVSTNGVIPATPFQITIIPPNSGTFVADMGVVNLTSGKVMRAVASAPAVDEYTVNTATGVYTFNTGNVGNSVTIYSTYSATVAGATALTLSNDLMGYQPSFQFVWRQNYNGNTLALLLDNCVSSKFSMGFKNDDFSMPDFEFDALDNGSGALGTLSQF